MISRVSEPRDFRSQSTTRCGVTFGPFQLYAFERLLKKGGAPVQVGSRALDLLIALVERAGEVVGKEELLARGWPRLTVDESSLRFQIAGLRRALGDGAPGARYIINVPGRGYCFVASTGLVEQSRRAGSTESMPIAYGGLNPIAYSGLSVVAR